MGQNIQDEEQNSREVESERHDGLAGALGEVHQRGASLLQRVRAQRALLAALRRQTSKERARLQEIQAEERALHQAEEEAEAEVEAAEAEVDRVDGLAARMKLQVCLNSSSAPSKFSDIEILIFCM